MHCLNGTDYGGFFSNIGTQSRYRIAKLSTIGVGIADPIWNPQPNTQSSNVNSIILHSGYLYAAGNFDTIGGLPRNNIAKLNLTGTGSAIGNWNPNVFNKFIPWARCGKWELLFREEGFTVLVVNVIIMPGNIHQRQCTIARKFECICRQKNQYLQSITPDYSVGTKQ
ncbi:MAG: delta-60 repeat domain-containing protein [Bacteroidetes bacterium]|nr:delta-60 repeat domain-containing protein [Bacteroidota bacterium]